MTFRSYFFSQTPASFPVLHEASSRSLVRADAIRGTALVGHLEARQRAGNCVNRIIRWNGEPLMATLLIMHNYEACQSHRVPITADACAKVAPSDPQCEQTGWRSDGGRRGCRLASPTVNTTWDSLSLYLVTNASRARARSPSHGASFHGCNLEIQ